MIAHVWSVLCAKTMIDKESNNLTILNVTEQLNLTENSFPSTIAIQLELVSLWARSKLNIPARANGRIRLFFPDGTEDVKPQVFAIDLTNHRRLRTRIYLNGVPAKGLGVVHFQVEMQSSPDDKWMSVARIPLEIMIAGPSANQPT